MKDSMEMFSAIRSVFGDVEVKQTDKKIVVSGIRAGDIIRDMNKFWKTTKITQNLFDTVSGRSFSFDKFFAPEVMYMLENIKYYRNRYTTIKAINSIREAMMENTWLKNTLPVDRATVPGRLDFRKLANLKFTAKPYQMEYFENYTYRLDQYGLNGDLIAAAPGTGKTYMTSAIAEMVSADLIFVFCPKIAVDTVWIDSINEMFKEPQTIWNSLDQGPYAGQRWVVCHYDQMDKVADMVRNVQNWKGKNVVTILDESHNFNDPNSARSTMYLGICSVLGSRNNLQASGTPVKALGAEIITLLRTVDPLFTPEVEVRFKKMFGREASKGLDIIKQRMGLVSFKIEKKELELQPPIMRPYPIKIPNGERFTLPEIKKVMIEFIREREKYYRARLPEDQKFWDQCVMIARSKLVTKEDKLQFDEYLHTVHVIAKTPDPRYLGEEMKRANAFEKNVFEKYLPRPMIERFRDVKSVIKYVRLKIQGEVLGRVVGGMRIEAHVAMVPFIEWVGITENTEKKTIAFTTFVECVEEAEKVTSKLGLKPATVYGKNSNELAGTVKRFEDDPNLNPLIATYASLSTAVRLTMADTMILINSPFRGYILEQAVSRIFRMGQDSQTYVYQCTLDTGEIPNISTRSADILAWSQQQVEAIMGIKAPYEMGEAMEAVDPAALNYDENEFLYRSLSSMYGFAGIDVDRKQFEKPKSTVPAYMR